MEKKTMGTFLAALRKANGMTQKQLAERLNVSDKAVSRWERDENVPDLTLIPVIAEVFGVTSDELLRGERADSTASSERAAAKAEKQLRHIIKQTLTTFKVRSILSAALALLGLLAAAIGNLGFLRAYIGFYGACVFFVAAALCQIVFHILENAALDNEEFDPALTREAKKKTTYISEATLGGIGLLFAFCLPLVCIAWSSQIGLSMASWLEFGLLFAAIGAILILAVCCAVNLKCGWWTLNRFRTPLGRLRTRCTALMLAMIVAIGCGQFLLAWYLSENRFEAVEYRIFHNWDDFKAYMQTPLDHDGNELRYCDGYIEGDAHFLIYENAQGERYHFQANAPESVYAPGNDYEPVVRYRRLNQTVADIRYSDDADLLPVRVYSNEALREEVRKEERIVHLTSLLHLAAPLTALAVYKRKKRSL